jgi:hypothetical protein
MPGPTYLRLPDNGRNCLGSVPPEGRKSPVRLQGSGASGRRLGPYLVVLVLIVIALGYWILVVNRPA